MPLLMHCLCQLQTLLLSLVSGSLVYDLLVGDPDAIILLCKTYIFLTQSLYFSCCFSFSVKILLLSLVSDLLVGDQYVIISLCKTNIFLTQLLYFSRCFSFSVKFLLHFLLVTCAYFFANQLVPLINYLKHKHSRLYLYSIKKREYFQANLYE